MSAPAIAVERNVLARQDATEIWTALVNSTATWNEISTEVFRDLDWQKLTEAAEHHGVFPVLCSRIFQSPVVNSLAAEVRERLRRRSHAYLLRSLPLIDEVLRIVAGFERAGVAVIPYKGPALAEQLWGDATLRVCDDLDFFVEEKAVDQAGEVLDRLDYRRVSPVAPHLRRALVRNASEEQFRHRETGLLVELQWSPAPRVFAIGYDSGAMWKRAVKQSLNGRSVLAPAPEDLLMLLSIHGWKHNWSKLIWVGDVAQLLLSHHFDWDRLFAVSRATGNARLVALALRMANRLFGIVVPKPFDFPDPALDALVSELISHMVSNRLCNYRNWHRYMLAARDSATDRARQITSFLLTPGLGEYATCELPAWASFGYRAVRVGRLLLGGRNKDEA